MREINKETLVIPTENIQVIKNLSVVYFADMMLTYNCDSIEEEFEEAVAKPLKRLGLKFDRVTCVDIPPFNKINYDILFFDYGGMSIGNSLLESFCKQIIKDANDNPSKYYVMVSSLTQWAMKEALKEFGECFNVYLTIDDFVKNFHI